MSSETQPSSIKTQTAEPNSSYTHHTRRALMIVRKALFLLIVFIAGLGSGFMLGRQSGTVPSATAEPQAENNTPMMIHQINPPEGYTIPATFGNIGPQMIAAGAIDLDKFVQVYKQAGKPLTDEQMNILTQESSARIVINPENAYFLLNFFWAFGLANQNAALTGGPMIADGKDKVGGFASTAGWTLGAKPPTELYAGTLMISLTEEQQARLMEVASSVYRPCCGNPTHFPDCNHGMAMLGLLELMASQNASTDEMFAAAKYINAFWYPQQMLEVATLFKAVQNVDFAQANARELVSYQFFSASGFQAVHQFLAANGLLEQAPSRSGSCGVQ